MVARARRGRAAGGRPAAAVQLDCDGEIALSAHYGAAPGAGPDRVYAALGRFLEVFAARGLRATLFVVGRDVADQGKRRLLHRALEEGHELANHTLSHPAAFLELDGAAREAEISGAQEALERGLGTRAAGFRAPNFELDEALLTTLQRLGFSYDSSLLPTPFGPALRAAKALLSPRTRRPSRGAYGRAAFGRSPRRPFLPAAGAAWREGRRPAAGAARRTTPAGTAVARPQARRAEGGRLVEVPLTVSPLLRLPCHASFALALPRAAGRALTRRALDGAERRGLPLVYLFHLSDLADAPALRGVEGRLYGGLEGRVAFVDWVCQEIARRFSSVTTAELARAAGGGDEGGTAQ